MELNNYIEHTLLKQDARKDEILNLAKEAKKYQFKGVCVNSCNVELVKKELEGTGVKIVSVIGFPLGDCTTATKVFETQEAINSGADEIDMVINTGRLKDGDYEYVKSDIAQVKHVCKEHILKVILETDLLNQEEIVTASKLAAQAGADFIKTSTGFVKGGVGAKVEDVKLMYSIASFYGIKVKASGGIRDKETAIQMIEAGAVRLGTSSGIAIMEG